MANADNRVEVTFVNYNYAFQNFYENYRNLCLTVSDKTRLDEIGVVHRLISTFVYEHDYTITNIELRESYRQRLTNIREEFENDQDVKPLLNKDFEIIGNRVMYRSKYYYYFNSYLTILGEYVSELTSSFMPNTNLQKKLIQYANNQLFFDNFTQHKKEVVFELSEFTLQTFTKCYNKVVTFYYAYRLFINKDDRITLEKLFYLVLAYYLDPDTLRLLNKELTSSQKDVKAKKQAFIHKTLNDCNSRMNESFSNYNVLPKIKTKMYIDKTLI